MNKKGFTLMELLAAIAILAVLAIIAIPNAMRLYNENAIKVMKVQETEIVESTNIYINDYCGKNAISESYRGICNNERKNVESGSTETNRKVYFCIKNIISKDYVKDVHFRSEPCNGIIVYDFNETYNTYSNGKTYFYCQNDSYHTEGYNDYSSLIESCP